MSTAAASPSAKTTSIPVTADNFIRAETDMYFGHIVKDGGFGRFHHDREPAPIDHQMVIRLNRDTLYSGAVFDLNAGPVTITLPDAGQRFMSLELFDEDTYVIKVAYGAGKHTLSRETIDTRYAAAAIRTLVDPSDPADIARVHALQDAVKVEQASAGTFETPRWDETSQNKVRDALLVLASTTQGLQRAFGTKDEVDPVHRLIGTAAGWGGNPDKEAKYIAGTPPQNDGKTVYRMTVKDVPVDGFWSVIVYDKNGYIPKNDRGVYSFNNLTAKKDADGSVTIQFGGDPAKSTNCIPIVPEWNYLVRLYRPRAEILSGKWKFPEAQAVN